MGLRIRVLDDTRSIIHVLFAAFTVIAGVDVAATIAYVAYQLVEREDARAKLGDFVEWLAGLALGALLRAALAARWPR